MSITKFKDIPIETSREAIFCIPGTEIIAFKNKLDRELYIYCRVKAKIHEIKVRPWREVLATDTE